MKLHLCSSVIRILSLFEKEPKPIVDSCCVVLCYCVVNIVKSNGYNFTCKILCGTHFCELFI